MNFFKRVLVVIAVVLAAIAIVSTVSVAQSTWQKVEIPGLPEWAEYIDLWSTSPTDVFVVIGVHEAYHGQRPMHTMVYYFDGSNWTMIFDEEGYWNYHRNVIFGTSLTDVYLIANQGPSIHQGEGHTWHFNGASWQEIAVPSQLASDTRYNHIGGSENNIHLYIQNHQTGQKNVIRYDGQTWSSGFQADTYGLMREFVSPDEGYLSNWGGAGNPNWAKWDGNSWVASSSSGRRYTQFSIWGTRDQANTLHLYDCGDPAYASRFIVTKINEDLVGWQDVVSEGSSPGFGACRGIWGPGEQGSDIYAVGYFHGGSWGGDGSGLVRVWHTSDGINWEIIDDDIAAAVGVSKLGVRGYQVWGTSSDDVWIVTRDALYHYGPTTLSPLVAHWSMNEGSGNMVIDDSGNDNHGTLHGPVWTTGIDGGALSFDKNYVEVPDAPSLRVGQNLTVEAWVNPQAMLYWDQGNWGYLVVKQKWQPGESTASYGLFIQKDWAHGFHFALYTSNGHKDVRSDPGLQYPIKWYHVVGSYDGSEIKIYLDGVLQATTPHSGDIVYNDQSLYIGRDAPINSHDHFYRGKVDEISIYNRTLTAAEIQERYELFAATNMPPIAEVNGPYSGYAGDAISLNSHGSFDPDGDALSFNWDCSDGGTASGPAPKYTFFNPGEYTVILTVDDGKGGIDKDTTGAVIFPLQPAVWQLQVSGATDDLYDVYFVDSMTGWAVGSNGLILKTQDAGTSWNLQNSGVTKSLAAVTFINTQTGWIVGDEGTALKTMDGGMNWVAENLNFPQDPTRYFLYDVYFVDSQHGWIVGNGAIVIQTVDGGQNWTTRQLGFPEEVAYVDAHFINPNTGFVCGSYVGTGGVVVTVGSLWQSFDGGQSVSPVLQMQIQDNTFKDVYFANSKAGWVIGDNSLIRNTVDGGNNWIEQDFGVANSYEAVHFVSATDGWVAGNEGFIIHTTDGGETWNYELTDVTHDLNGLFLPTDRDGWAVGDKGTVLHYSSGEVVTKANISLPETSAPKNTSITIPITVDTDSTIGLAQFIVEYSSNLLTYQNAQTGPNLPGSITLQTNVNLPFAPTHPGTDKNILFQLSGGGTSSFTGKKEVINLTFQVIGSPESDANIYFDRASNHTFLTTTKLNEIASDAISFTDGKINILHPSFTVHGTVSYTTSQRPVQSCAISVNEVGSGQTDSNGHYSISEIPTGTYTVIPEKTGGLGSAISGSDGLAVLRYLAFLKTLTDHQKNAADVTQDGRLSGSDGLGLLRYLAFFPDNIGQTGQWKFWPDEAQVTGPPDVQQDFTTTIIGDVTQNWNQGAVLAKATNDTLAKLSLPGQITGFSGDTLVVPISVESESNIGLVQFVVEFDSGAVSIEDIYLSNEIPGFHISQVNKNLPFLPVQQGMNKNVLVQISSGGTSSFTGTKVVANLTVVLLGQPNTTSTIYFDRAANHTFLTTLELVDISGESIAFQDGAVQIQTITPEMIELTLATVNAVTEDSVLVPINVVFPENASIGSAEITISSNPNLLEFCKVVLTSGLAGSNGWSFETNQSDNLVKTALAGANDLNGEGTLFWYQFYIPDQAPAFIPITIEHAIFNTGETPVQLTHGGINVMPKADYGDTDLNGIVQAYDASLILKYLADHIEFDQQQLLNADVTLDQTVSGLDASVILQYLVGIIDRLPYQAAQAMFLASGDIAFGDQTLGKTNQRIMLPLTLTNGTRIVSFDGMITYNADHLILEAVRWTQLFDDFMIETNYKPGQIEFVGAGTNPSSNEGTFVNLEFKLNPVFEGQETTVSVSEFRWNEGPILKDITFATIYNVLSSASEFDIPNIFVLEQNYPNPFNPSTEIRFQVPEATAVQIKIFNALGQTIRTLVNERLSAGYHTAFWDGRDETGQMASPGVYFYKMETDQFSQTKKLVFMK